MEINEINNILEQKIKAGKKMREARKLVKNYVTQKQDIYDDSYELMKPSIDTQESIKKTIDEKQDELINQLLINDELNSIRQNQLTAVSRINNQKQDELKNRLDGMTNKLDELKNVALLKSLPKPEPELKPLELPEPEPEPEPKPEPKKVYKLDLDLDKDYNVNDIKILMKYKLPPPSQVLQSYQDGLLNLEEFKKEIGLLIKEIGRQKGHLSTTKVNRNNI